jgi:hypothetical protein
MSRVINPDSTGKERTQLSKAVMIAIRELARQTDTGAEARDLAAFIALALKTIATGIDGSVAAWEKRGYWVKADRFRMEWLWAATYANDISRAVLADDWPSIARLITQTAQRLERVHIPQNHRLGRPWSGAYERLKAQLG